MRIRRFALLTSTCALFCAAKPAVAQISDNALTGIVSQWSAQNNTLDDFGLNNGIPVNSPAYAPGIVGSAFQLNGLNQSIRVPDSPSLHFSRAITVEAWIHPRVYHPPAASLLVKYDGTLGVNQSCFSFSINYPESTLYLLVSSDGTPAKSGQLNSTATIPLNTWTHVAATYDGATISLYINGKLDSSLPYSGGIFPGADDLAIGANVGGIGSRAGVALFDGLIDQPALYNRALSGSEIQSSYAAVALAKQSLPAPAASQTPSFKFVAQRPLNVITPLVTPATDVPSANLVPDPNLNLSISSAVQVAWPAVPGKIYQVQSATDLTSPIWTNLGDTLVATSTNLNVFDATSGNNQKYYRVLTSP